MPSVCHAESCDVDQQAYYTLCFRALECCPQICSCILNVLLNTGWKEATIRLQSCIAMSICLDNSISWLMNLTES